MNNNDLTNLSKKELFIKCKNLNIKRYLSKNKSKLINLIKLNTIIEENVKNNINVKETENIKEEIIKR